MSGAHSRLSSSSAYRWTVCSGAPHAEAQYTDRTSIYAAEGTVYHDVIADCLMFGLDAQDFLGKTFEEGGHTFIFDDEFVRYMQPALDRIRELTVDANSTFIETRVDTSPWTEPGTFGTVDFAWINIEKRELGIYDHKYGKGIPVNPYRNMQTALYALGFWNTVAWMAFGTDEDVTVRLIIDQPRVEGGGGEWTCTLQELFEIGNEIREAAARTVPVNAPRTAGEHCHFCKARFRCAERAAWNLEMVGAKFDDLDEAAELDVPVSPSPIGELSVERLVTIARNAALIRKWVSDVHTHVLRMALMGQETPGLKAVEGRKGHRRWKDENQAEQVLIPKLQDAAFVKKLLSPAQAEKLVGKEPIRELWEQPPGKPALVPLSHPGTPLQSWAEKFDAALAAMEDEDDA